MPKSDSLQGSLDLLVLKILSRRHRLHGYAIMSAIRDMSDDVLRVEEVPSTRRCTGWKRPAGSEPNGSPRTPDGGHVYMK